MLSFDEIASNAMDKTRRAEPAAGFGFDAISSRAFPQESPQVEADSGGSWWAPLHSALNFIDTPGRFVRTAIGTGDLGQAWDALWDPSKSK